LKGFKKVFLKAGESKTVTIPFDDKTFRFWNVKSNQWEVEGGNYDILVGSSSADIRLSASKYVEGNVTVYPYHTNTMQDYYDGKIQAVSDKAFEALLGYSIPSGSWNGQLGANDAICQMYYAKSGLARFLYKRLTAMKKKSDESGVPDLNILFIYNMPFRAIAMMSGGIADMNMVHGIVSMINGHFWSGLGKVISGFIKNSRENKKFEKLIKG
jgi:beta-glucosidase